jgi:multiple sugar transport system permease protein
MIADPALPAPSRRRKGGRLFRAEGRAGWLFSAPGLLLLVVFIIVPFLLSIVLSFSDARLTGFGNAAFVGIRNYVRLFDDGLWWRSVGNNLLFAAVVVPVQTCLALWLATIVNRPYRGRNLYRMAFFIPVVAVAVVSATIWRLLLADFGLVNATINSIFGAGSAPRWLQDGGWAMPAIMLVFIWRNVGFQMIVVLAGLQGVPREQYEAARVDGATAWQQFRYVTLPGLKNTLIFVTTFSTIFAFRLFDEVFIMTQGGPGDSTQTVLMQMVRVGFSEQKIGQAAGMAVFYFLIVLAITLLQRLAVREERAT